MSVLLAVAGLPLVLAVPGLCTVAALAPLRRLSWLERAYLALALSLAVSGWVGLILAQTGLFSAGLLVALLALYSLVLGLLAWRRGRWRWPRPEGPREPLWVVVTFLAITVVFGFLAFRPFELILGPRDAAVYPATAAQIAQHGSIAIHDPILGTLAPPTTDDTNRTWVQFLGLQHPGRFYYHYIRMPGFFVADIDQAIIVPQFYHLYPTWLAEAFSLVGVQAGLLMTPYLSLMGGIGVFLVARRLLGARVALLGYLFLGLQTLQVWFARYSTAEGATQLLLFLALYGLVRLEEDEDSRAEPFWGLLTGAALGMIGLVRVEFFFPWLLMLPYLFYLLVARRIRRGHRALLITGAVFVLHTMVQLVALTRGYTIGIYYHHPIQDSAILSWLVYPLMTPTMREYWTDPDTPRTLVLQQPWRLSLELGAIVLLAAVLLALRYSPRLVAWLGERLRRWGRVLLLAATGLFLALFAYLYLVRPGVITGQTLLHPLENRATWEGYIGAPVPEGSAANMVRLGWYFSPLGMVLAALGIAGLIARESSRRSWFLLAPGLFYLFFFNYETFGVPHHIYIMRRYVSMVVPFLCLAMAYALEWLGLGRRADTLDTPDEAARRGRPSAWIAWFRGAAAAALAAAMVAYFVYTGLPFYRHQEYQGALAQVEALAGRFGPDDVVLLIDDARDAPFTLATPLRFLFDRNAFVIMPTEPDGARIEAQVRRWQAEGRTVYLLVGNDGGRLFMPHTRLRWLERFELSVPEFEQLTAQKPHNAYILRQPFGLYLPEPWSGPGSPLGDLPLQIDLGTGDYIYQAGGFYQDEVAPDGTTYCWTQMTGTLRLPWPQAGGTVTLTLRLAGGKRPAELGPARVEVRLGEQVVAAWQLEQGFAEHRVVLPAATAVPDEAGTVLLRLVAAPWKQVDYGLGGDRRPLGVEVDWVRVETGDK